MSSITNLANGIFIGDSALAAFAEISRNKSINSGLFDKTTDSGVRKNNTKNNFPRTASYYDTLQKLGEKPMEFKRFLFGNLVSGDNIDGLDIGWAYTTDINQYRPLDGGYASSADFTEFQRLLRGEALTRGGIGAKGQNIHVNIKYKDYGIVNYTIEHYKNSENLGVIDIPIGDSYAVGEDKTYRNQHKILKETHNDYAWIKRSDFYKIPSIDDVFLNSIGEKNNVNGSNGNELAKYVKEGVFKRGEYSTIDDFNKIIQYHITQNTNTVVKEYGDSTTIFDYKPEFLVNDRFKEPFKLKEFKLEDLKSFVNEKNKGLKNSVKYRDYNEKQNANIYSRNFQYVFNTKEDTIFYDVNSKNTLGDEQNFTISFGEHSDIIPYSSVENDNGISDKGGNVNIIRRTENLFRTCKINSLINRTNTNTKYAGEVLTRGRKLENEKGTGYCRVWTAKHQYSKMTDVIRPFYNDKGDVIGLDTIQKKLSQSMRPNNGVTKLVNNTVLQNNGFVRINPSHNNRNKTDGTFIQNYMFSIENLAWKDKNHTLTKEQLGPNKGRIMWFPPYNLKFSENISVNWNGNNFIGRGEQIYTYTNTERSGTLDFTLLIDHPSILNEWRGTGNGANKKEDELLRFFAGCGVLEKDETIKEMELKREEPVKQPVKIESQQQAAEKKTEAPAKSEEKAKADTGKIVKLDAKLIDGAKRFAYIIFYPDTYPYTARLYKKNDNSLNYLKILKDLCKYETSKTGTCIFEGSTPNKNLHNLNTTQNEFINEIKDIIGGNHDDLEVKFLINDIITEKIVSNSTAVTYNNSFSDGNNLFGLDLSKYEVKLVEYHSTATSTGKKTVNQVISKRRLELLKGLLTEMGLMKHLTGDKIEVIDKPFTSVNVTGDKVNGKEAKYGRIGLAIISMVPKEDLKTENEQAKEGSTVVNNLQIDAEEKKPGDTGTTIVEQKDILPNEVSRVENEYLYFTEIAKSEAFIEPIRTRIRHFDPAFHSLTPEGFNARLTFLHQCTRQGPTAELGSNNQQGGSYAQLTSTASNLSFGRAPYCILRIGDFFNTKICIDSISINYDNGGGTQWDLNPEGAGVQPMFANVSINFKFLGGQDIAGPVEKLQNAITSNYYANASVYDVNADDGTKK